MVVRHDLYRGEGGAVDPVAHRGGEDEPLRGPGHDLDPRALGRLQAGGCGPQGVAGAGQVEGEVGIALAADDRAGGAPREVAAHRVGAEAEGDGEARRGDEVAEAILDRHRGRGGEEGAGRHLRGRLDLEPQTDRGCGIDPEGRTGDEEGAVGDPRPQLEPLARGGREGRGEGGDPVDGQDGEVARELRTRRAGREFEEHRSVVVGGRLPLSVDQLDPHRAEGVAGQATAGRIAGEDHADRHRRVEDPEGEALRGLEPRRGEL